MHRHRQLQLPGTMGYLCKHRVKVIALATQCSKPAVVLFLGTWAGSERGGMSQLPQRNTSAAQPEPDSWSQLADTFELEAEVQEREQSVSIPAVSAPAHQEQPQQLSQLQSSACQVKLTCKVNFRCCLSSLGAMVTCAISWPASSTRQKELSIS